MKEQKHQDTNVHTIVLLNCNISSLRSYYYSLLHSFPFVSLSQMQMHLVVVVNCLFLSWELFLQIVSSFSLHEENSYFVMCFSAYWIDVSVISQTSATSDKHSLDLYHIDIITDIAVRSFIVE